MRERERGGGGGGGKEGVERERRDIVCLVQIISLHQYTHHYTHCTYNVHVRTLMTSENISQFLRAINQKFSTPDLVASPSDLAASPGHDTCMCIDMYMYIIHASTCNSISS